MTLALLKLQAVLGVTGYFNTDGSLKSMGIQCAMFHSTVDNSLAPGIGHRLDGWANRDLNVGMIVSLAPNLQPVADLLHVSVGTVQKVLRSWGPGKSDAELFLDGKAFRPDGNPAATLIPPAFGLAGVNFDAAAAERGDDLFEHKARCNNCHVEPLWSEAGWNMHTPAEICIDSFQAARAPDRQYRTSPLAGLFTHQKGGFYHDGRFPTLKDVVNHYNGCMALGLTEQEKNDLVQYLLSL